MDTTSRNYIISNFKNTGAKKFCSQSSKNGSVNLQRTSKFCLLRKRIKFNLATPGPGTYILPSDFGIIQEQASGSNNNFFNTRGKTKSTIGYNYSQIKEFTQHDFEASI